MKFRLSHRFLAHLLLLVTCHLSLSFLWADNQSNLSSNIEKLIVKYGLTESKIGIKIVSLSDSKIIYAKDADVPLIPASNLKLFTTAAGLCLLGPEFQYETKLYRLGTIHNGVLEGKLIVKSNGDPNISGRFYNGNTTAVFEEWGDVLLKSGIKEIKGDIIIDDTAFDREYILASWPADQLSYWYCAQISGVSFNDNCVDITVYPDKDTDKIKYQFEPSTDYVTIINNCKQVSDKSQHLIDFYRAPGTNIITIKGKCWAKAEPYKESITIDNPGLWFGTVLKETLMRKKGIPVSGRVRLAERTYQEENRLLCLALVKTDLLTSINVVNKRSQNFYAEQILKTLGYHFAGKGTFKNGLVQVRKFLTNEVKITEKSFRLVDGSGLSRENQISPGAIIRLLIYLHQHKSGKEFRESLALSKEDKGLRKHLSEDYKDKVFAKTGYVKDVSALAGYFKTDPQCSDKDYVFSIMINDFPDRSSVEQFQCEILKLLSGE